jgi:hypothetical protein
MLKKLWLFVFFITLFIFYKGRDFNSRYEKSINGDAKGYYAYLPAIFIYQDPDYKFIDKMEKQYYPEDFSHAKHFKNKQRNGKYVNKCFPGLAVLYLPFFALSTLFAWLAEIPIDGYSVPFQIGIGFAHVFYLFFGLYLINSILKKINLSHHINTSLLISLVFGSNIFYYIIYDHTVGHIFNFFLATLLIWLIHNLIESKKTKWIGFIGILMSLIVITRPTNALMLLFTPFIFHLFNENLFTFIKGNIKWKGVVFYIPFMILTLLIAPLAWKWQCDLWVVYSYNNEGFHFPSQNWFNFLFSYKKGWFLWSPLIFIFFLLSIYLFFKKSIALGLKFTLPFIIITYILSSWWCWTFGGGMGQRVMIDFYPFLIIGIAVTLQNFKYKKTVILFAIPLSLLNIVQAFQIRYDILKGDRTDSKTYWNHFLQLKTDAPTVEIEKNWERIAFQEDSVPQITDTLIPFSRCIESKALDDVRKIVVTLTVGGKHGNKNISLVVSNKKGDLYHSTNLYGVIYEKPRKMSFVFDIPLKKNEVYKTYIYNSNTNEKVAIQNMSVKYFK